MLIRTETFRKAQGGDFNPSDVAGLTIALYGWGDGQLRDTAGGTYSGALNDAPTPGGSWVGTRWDDMSGNGNHATQATTTDQPLLVQNALNGNSLFRFDGTNHWWSFAVNLSGLTAGEAFILLKIDADPPADSAQSGLLAFGDSDLAGHYPFTSGAIFESFGTTNRKSVGDPAAALTSWRIYNISSALNNYVVRLDETTLFLTGTNTVAFLASDVRLGRNRGVSLQKIDGDIAAFLLYDSVLGTSNRAAVHEYLRNQAGL